MADKVDINDLSLDTSEVEINPEADAFAYPPPPVEGRYRVRLKLHERGWEKGTDKYNVEYMRANIEARIVAPGDSSDDKPLFDNPSTQVFASSGTSKIVGILQALGMTGIPPRGKIHEYARFLQPYLEHEAEVDVMTQWEAYCKDCEKSIKGMRRFPTNGDGGHKGAIECPGCGAELNAQARISKYMAVGS